MKKIYFILFLTIVSNCLQGQGYTSPNRQIGLNIDQTTAGIILEVFSAKQLIMRIDSIQLSMDGVIINERFKFVSSSVKVDDFSMVVPLKYKKSEIAYREVKFKLNNTIDIEFKIFDNGFAYRFTEQRNKRSEVIDFEKLSLNFDDSAIYYYPKEDKLLSHYERSYIIGGDDSIPTSSFCSLPLVIKSKGISICVSETNLYNYPNLFLKKQGPNTLVSLFPKAVLDIKPQSGRGEDRNEILVKEASYIAKGEAKNRTIPWRTFAIGTDASLITNEINHYLGDGPEGDYSWVKPGKVAWDWYNANLITGVDFKNGINNDTYKFYIDFAAKNNLEYIILDEGWSASTIDVIHNAPAIDVEELVAYGRSKNVGVILWLLWKPLDTNLDQILDSYQKWGVKGIKVDFMQRADQYMVNFYERVAKAAAARKLLVDYHGAFKPVGLHMKYPNVINYEGVKGNENNKWSDWANPKHNVTIPFIRMVAGPMDYTPGAMRNANKKDFSISFNHPMSITTRAHQAAMYVIYESPLQMLCDLPSSYMKEPEYTSMISKVSTTWHDTKVIDASIGNHIILARRNNETWYLAGMTDKRYDSTNIDLSFLNEGKYSVVLLEDGVNVENTAEDYRIKSLGTLQKSSFVNIKMHTGGGFLMICEKVKN